MKKLFLTLTASLFVGCQYAPPLASGEIDRIRMIDIAKAELSRRRISLPPKCITEVDEDVMFSEFRPDIPIFIVSFNAPDRSRPVPLYRVIINKKSGRVQNFVDTHIISPGHE